MVKLNGLMKAARVTVLFPCMHHHPALHAIHGRRGDAGELQNRTEIRFAVVQAVIGCASVKLIIFNK
jgi:hypothetical protein